MNGRWSILNVTDIHFGSEANYLDDPKELCTPEERHFRESALRNFKLLLRGLARSAKKSFDLVAVGGDLTDRGKPEGISKFHGEILPILWECAREHQAVCLVPGNHDVEWGLDVSQEASFNKKFQAFRDMLDEASFPCTTCYLPTGNLAGNNDNLQIAPPRRGPIYRNKERKIIALCINSAIRCGEIDTYALGVFRAEMDKELQNIKSSAPSGRTMTRLRNALDKTPLRRDIAHVTATQRGVLIDHLEDERQKVKEEGEDWDAYLRVAILHHHLTPFEGQSVEHRGYANTLDSSYLLSLLTDFDFDLVLTGHKHQAYEAQHLVRKKNTGETKEIFLIGGLTVGGYEVPGSGSGRGFRWIEVEDREGVREFQIWNVSCAGASLERQKTSVDKLVRELPPRTVFTRRVKSTGYGYREIVALTRITEDGDGSRVVECDGLTVYESDHELIRTRSQTVVLPWTSGYLDAFQAQGKGFSVRVVNPIPKGQQEHCWKPELRFPSMTTNKPISYQYRWSAVNGFALDKGQFHYMYGENAPLPGIEFTHFPVNYPVQELNVMVRFPDSKKFQPKGAPRIRVTKIDDSNPTNWGDSDLQEEERLDAVRALHYHESLNLASLRVSNPKLGYTYGIQWDVPDKLEELSLSDELRRLRESAKNPLSDERRETLIQDMHQVLTYVHNWIKHMSELGHFAAYDEGLCLHLLFFDGERSLRPWIAIREIARDGGEYQLEDFTPQIMGSVQPYGIGIEGRALKANDIRLYRFRESSERDPNEEPDYHISLRGSPDYKVLIAFPIHGAEDKTAVERDPQIYKKRIPFGVVAFGSDHSECPLRELIHPEYRQYALKLQHFLNQVIYPAVKKFIVK